MHDSLQLGFNLRPSTFFDNFFELASWAQRFDRHAYDTSLFLLKEIQPARMLEIGCGTGNFAKRALSELSTIEKYYGTEISTKSAQKAKVKLVKFPIAEISEVTQETPIPYSISTPIDVIFSSYVLDGLSVESIVSMFWKFKGILSPGGVVISQTMMGPNSARSIFGTAAWKMLNRINPAITGFSKPIDLPLIIGSAVWSWQQFPVEGNKFFPSIVTVATIPR